jgi:NAD(P)-dependent dehydrogenase (short-subunit alcohol dehydrogenase family)
MFERPGSVSALPRHEERIVVVTGGGRGIGAAICEEFARDGARIAVWDVDAEAAASIAASIDGARAYEVDITDSGAVDAATAGVIDDFGGLHVLVNNAGVSLVGDHTQDLSDEIWNTSIGIMQTGVFFCSRAAGRHMIEQRDGAIVNISSIRGFSPNPGRLAYCAAKAAVILMTKVMAAEWGPFGVRVNAVAPGVQATGMWNREVALGMYDEQSYLDAIPAHRLGEPAEVGRLCSFLASAEAGYITGACVTIDGGLTLIPAG